MNLSKITIVTGHYGSGKTNFAVNLAIEAAKTGKTCTIIDFDIVNPYFRTADFKALFEKYNIRLEAPKYANTNLDLPVITFSVEGIVQNSDYTIIDVGGDDTGAVALGVYADYLKTFDDMQMLYVINKYRYMTETPEETISLMREIERSSKLKCTGIINNSNLGIETNETVIMDSLDYAQKCSELANLPLIYTTYDKRKDIHIDRGFPLEIHVKTIWNKDEV